MACEAAVGKRESISIFGTNLPTPDGTGVRDYIHVEDLADAHVRSLDYLVEGGDSAVLNCGYGHGYSVREILRAVEEVSGTSLKVIETGPRRGDPSSLVAKTDRISEVLNWTGGHDDLHTIVGTALAWERKLLAEANPG